jgi:hypothetical protein
MISFSLLMKRIVFRGTYITFPRRKMMKRGIFIFLILFLFVAGTQFVSAEKCRIQVRTEPQGAMFAVNLAVLKFGPTPMFFEFDRGKNYSITFTKDGYKTKLLNYTADCKDIVVQLEKEGSSVPAVDTTKSCILKVACNVVNASVYIDGELKGKIPFATKLNYGSHTVRVTQSGYGEYEETVLVDQPTMTVTVTLRKSGGSTVNNSGILQVKSNIVNASVYIDNELKGKIPFSTKLQYGTYTIRVTSSGYGEYEESVTLNRPELVVTATLSNTIRSSTVQIMSNVKGAKVYIDDDYKGQAPVMAKLEYGVYDVRVTAEGYDDYAETIDIDQPSFKVNANLERWRSTRLQVISNVKDADAYIDGERAGRVPLDTNVDFGTHELIVSADGYEDYVESFEAKARDMKINANLERAVKVSLTIYCNIAGADVFINNTRIGKTPIVREQNSGTYKLKVSLPGSGYDDYTTTLRLRREDTVVDALLTADNQIQVELPLRSKVRVDNVWYEINWEQSEKKKQQTQVVTIYAPEKKRAQMHDLYIEYNGLELSKQVKFYGVKEKVPVLKLGLSLE